MERHTGLFDRQQESKIAIVMNPDLGTRPSANGAAFLATGLAARHPEIIGRDLIAADGTALAGFTKVPILILLFVVSLSFAACNSSQSPDSSGTSQGMHPSDVVPQEFRHLLPMAQRWGVGDDGERSELTGKATADDQKALYDAVHPYRQQINSWLDSFGQNPMPDEAASFLYMLEAMEEMGI